MAKDKKASKKAEKTETAEKTAEFKYGVQDIADALDIKPASVRVQLRNKGIEKNGKSYGWNSKSELNEVVGQLRASNRDEDDEDEAPARKSKKSKAEKPAKGKKAKKASSKRRRDEDEDEDDDDFDDDGGDEVD